MQVSRLLALLCLALLAIVLYIATPAIALEHPWEEGETPGTGPGDAPGTSNPNPDTDSIQTPLFSAGTQGTVFWWFELIVDLSDGNILTQNESVAPAAESGTKSIEHRSGTGSVK